MRFGKMGGKLGGRLALVVAGVSAAGLVAAAAPANAASSTAVTIVGGQTTSVSSPGLAKSLLANGIIPFVSKGANITGLNGTSLDDLTLTFTFKITGGSVDPAAFLSGTIQHTGDLTLVRPFAFKAVTIGSFQVINDANPRLIATVNGKKQVTMFTLDLSGLALSGATGEFDLGNVGLVMTADGAQALDSGLGVSIFKAGLKFGTGTTVIKYTPAA